MRSSPQDAPWVSTLGTVTSCRYQSAALSSMAFGISLSRRFRITFDYYAHGQLFSDEFQSDRAIAQNEPLELSYNPLDPRQNSRSNTASATGTSRSPLIIFGIGGSVVLSLLWLAVLRGCQ